MLILFSMRTSAQMAENRQFRENCACCTLVLPMFLTAHATKTHDYVKTLIFACPHAIAHVRIFQKCARAKENMLPWPLAIMEMASMLSCMQTEYV